MRVLDINNSKQTIINAIVGHNVKIFDFVNIYGCQIDDDTVIGTFVEIQRCVKIGKKCHIQSHTFICEGVTIEDDVFIGHGVVFINDNNPTVEKILNKTWRLLPVLVKEGATIGSGATILGGITIGKKAIIGAGAVVTHDVPDNVTVIGVPARDMNKEAV